MIDYESLMAGLTAFAALAILVSGLDDMFIDGWYYGSQAYRRFFSARYPQVSEAELRAKPEQPIAVMIPAWHEHAVIAKMLANTLGTVDYRDYVIFVGTYPNDEATMMAVAEVALGDPRIQRIVCPHDGPTNKADCLNWIIEGIRHYEKRTGKSMRILMLHDSEDLVHPLSFRLMNHFIPRVPMVQLPVIPFEARSRELTAGTYLDEFAESHLKDMLVRERLSGMVPSAGVGTGFSRDAIDRLARRHNNQVFNVSTFTEDYDLSFRLKELGESSALLLFYVERTRSARRGRLQVVRELVGTREYFPARFSDAVRQKARWTLGIVFHGWQQRGWEGGWMLRYMVWRDRKTLMTNTVNMLGYLLLLEAGLSAELDFTGAQASYGRLAPDSWVWPVIQIDALLLANRCAQRMITIARFSTCRQAALSLPRIVWGNVVNFCAVARAATLFVRTSLLGQKLVWAKTAHAFPSEEGLLAFKRKLGDLLLEERLLTLAQLNKAIATQRETGRRLGDVLIDLGYLPEEELVRVLGAQLRVETRHIDCDRLDEEAAGLIPECASREHLMIVADSSQRPAVIAAADIADARMRKWLDANFPGPYRLVLAGRRNIISAVDRLNAPPRPAVPAMPFAPFPLGQAGNARGMAS